MFWNLIFVKCIFERYENFSVSKRNSNKLSNDTKLMDIDELLLFFFFLFSLYFSSYFAQYLKISLADI